MSRQTIEFGLFLPQLKFSFDDIKTRVQCADALGFHAVWFMDHFYPPGLPAVESFEAWTLVSALAPLTRRIRLGHLVLCNAFRHPGLLASMAASLDVISGGRLDLGLGTGSVAGEFEQFGIPRLSFAERSKQLEETILILKALFTQAETSFAGSHYQLSKAPLPLKPVQKPHPPILIGGGGEKFTLPLAARHADMWNCPTYDVGQLERKLALLRAECEKIGRDPASLRVSEQALLVIGATEAEADAALAQATRRYGAGSWGLAEGYAGTPGKIIERIRARAALGISQFCFFFSDRAAPATLELFAKEVMPAFQR